MGLIRILRRKIRWPTEVCACKDKRTGVQCAAGIGYLSNFEARNQVGVFWSIFLKSPATITLSLCLVCPAYMHAVFSYPEHVRKYWKREMKIGIDMNLGATWRSRLPILDIQFVLDHPWPAKGSWSSGPKKSLLKAYHRKTWPNYQFRKKRNNKQQATQNHQLLFLCEPTDTVWAKNLFLPKYCLFARKSASWSLSSTLTCVSTWFPWNIPLLFKNLKIYRKDKTQTSAYKTQIITVY